MEKTKEKGIESLCGQELTERAGTVLGMMETAISEGISALAKGGARTVVFDEGVPVFNDNFEADGFTVDARGRVRVTFGTALPPMCLSSIDAADAMCLLWHILERYYDKETNNN